jgi:hypothetical protein
MYSEPDTITTRRREAKCTSQLLYSRKTNSSEGKAIPMEAYYRPIGFQEVEATRFLDNRHMKMVRF